jgi:hypothetical protein
MSRGPGRIQRAITAAFERDPKRSFTTDELVELAYPGVRRIETKHRVAVLRAAWHVAPKYSRVALTMSGTWGMLLFVNKLDEVGLWRGRIRAWLPSFWWLLEVAEAKGIPSPDWTEEEPIRKRAYAIWEEEGRPEGRDLDHWRRAAAEINLGAYEEWWRVVRLQAPGEIERAVAEWEKELTSIMTKLGVGRADAARVFRLIPWY